MRNIIKLPLVLTIAILALQINPVALAAESEIQNLQRMKQSMHPNGAARYIDAQELQHSRAFVTGDYRTRARRVISFYKNKLKIRDAARQLALIRIYKDKFGNTHARYRQRHRGIPVDGSNVSVHFTRQGKPTSVTGIVVPNINLPINALLNGRAAGKLAVSDVGRNYATPLTVRDLNLVIYNDGLVYGRRGKDHLAYKVTVQGRGVREFVYISAVDGSVVARFTGVHTARNRLTFDMNNNSNYFAASLERAEGDPPTGDADVDNAHDFSGDTYDFFFNAYGRDSIDDNGFTLRSYTHYFNFLICPNAFWDGLRMTYCDGFPIDDVAAHEITHGLIDNTARLIYFAQPGALNESLSDIFGETIDQLNGKGTDTAGVQWLVGEDLPGIGTIRNMANPPALGDPDRVSHPNYVCGLVDSGGVHSNSGVPNKNYYLLVEGGSFNGQTIQPLGLTKAAAIHYQALTNYLTPFTQFPGYFISLWRSCLDLIGSELQDPQTGQPSGEILTFGQCIDVLRAGASVEFLTPAC